MRYQLLFQRTIPDFEPSAESYAIAVATFDLGRDMLASAGITDAASLDLWTALLTGMVDQQLANDPGGQALDPTPRRRRGHVPRTPEKGAQAQGRHADLGQTSRAIPKVGVPGCSWVTCLAGNEKAGPCGPALTWDYVARSEGLEPPTF